MADEARAADVSPRGDSNSKRAAAFSPRGLPNTPELPSRSSTPWRRFCHNRSAVVSAVVLCLMVLVSLTTLPFSLRWYNVQSLDTAVRHAPSAAPVVGYEEYARAFGASGGSRGLKPAAQGEIEPPRGLKSAARKREDGSRGLKPAARGGTDSSRGLRLGESTSFAAHGVSSWLGHDDLGRSLLFRLLPGLLVSLAIGVAAAGVAVMIGVPWGATAALAGGRVDAVMMRIVDVLYGLPYILMVILLKIALTRPLTALFGDRPGYANCMILLLAIGGVSWLTLARVVRGQALSLREQPFIEAARAIGASPFRIILVHLLPNLIGPVMVYATLVLPQAILQESFLSFLGLGVQQPMPSLGRLAADGVEAVNTFVGFWWLLVFPCGALVLTLLALNFVGDGLRDALDPKSSPTALV